MSLFTIAQALQPQGGHAQQLFIIFTEDNDEQQHLAVCQHLAKTFPSAAIIIALPGDDLLYTQELRERKTLSANALGEFVQQHAQDIQGFIKTFQQHLGIEAAATALIGVGQIGSLVLELSKLDQPLAGRLMSFGSRFAQLPTEQLSLDQTIHLFHAAKDPLLNYEHSVQAQQTIAQLQGDATIDVAHQESDSFGETLRQQMTQRLLSCVPLRYWKEAEETALSPEPAQRSDTLH